MKMGRYLQTCISSPAYLLKLGEACWARRVGLAGVVMSARPHQGPHFAPLEAPTSPHRSLVWGRYEPMVGIQRGFCPV